MNNFIAFWIALLILIASIAGFFFHHIIHPIYVKIKLNKLQKEILERHRKEEKHE